jgi:hypothetical protein
MATSDQIPSDLTLELGEGFAPDKFVAAARAFFGYIEECARLACSDGQSSLEWTVAVREGSSLLSMVPSESISPAILNDVCNRAELGAGALARGNIEGAGLPDLAVKHLKTLSELTETKHRLQRTIRLWVRRKPIVVGPEIARVVREDWRADYKDYGVIEGRLKAIQEQGSLLVQIRDEALGVNVRGYFSEEMLQKAFENFRKRIEVSGIIHYRKNGTPVSIEVSQIVALPNDADLPTFADVRGLLRVS